MKIFFFVILYIFSSIFCVYAQEIEIDKIAAIVNDDIILNSEVNKILFFLKKQGNYFRAPLKINFLKEKVIQKLIIDTLMLQEAKKMNITVSQEQIDSVIQKIAFKKNMSVNEFKKDVMFNNFNIDGYIAYDNYVKNIEKILKIKIIQEYTLYKNIHISEQEVNFLLKKNIENNQKFKRINLSYILLPSLKKDPNNIIENKKILLENITNKLKHGYKFENLYTECKKNNVFLVKKMFWMRYSDIQSNFFDPIKIFKKGQVLGPFLGKKGFYIFKINDIKNNKEKIMNEYYIQHCLIKPSLVLSNLESKNNIFNIYKNIKNGVYSFDYAVKNLSHDFYSSSKKGNLGWISTEFFNHNINKELLNLKKNEISKPIQSNFGWHIIKLLDQRQIDKFYNFEKKQIYNILFNKKMKIEQYKWINHLKDLAYIKIIES